MDYHALTVALLGLFLVGVISYKPYTICNPNNDVCEYWLVLEEKLTMVHNSDLVYGHAGLLYKYNQHWSNASSTVSPEDVISSDGFQRMVIAINTSVPGPPIVMYEGQTVLVHVRNKLLSDSAAIHWHGIHQRGTPWMDGVAYISQCPIGPGQTFTYRFKAEPRGTYWYHSHVGAQRTNGAFGAFIVKERPKDGVVQPRDMLMTVGDWHHHDSNEVYVRMVYGNFINNKKYKTTTTLDGGKFSGVPWVSALIEGKGRYFDPATGVQFETPLAWFNVTKGETVRFRVIGVGAIYPLRISVDQHNLTLIASDAFDIEETPCESFIINPGERFDFLLTANQEVSNYWIRAVSMEANVYNHTTEAILHYEGADTVEPKTRRQDCTQNSVCVVVNCPFLYFPTGYYTKCLTFHDIAAKDPETTPVYEEGKSEEHFLNFHFPGTVFTPGAVNGRKFEMPGISSLTQSDQIADNYDCKNKNCGEDKVCFCHYGLDLPFNQTIQMVWINMGSGKGWSHPVHLHGHSFYLLKMGYPAYDPATGQLTADNPDVDCGGDPKQNFCNEARWSSQDWTGGNIPGLNLKNPPRKDSIIVPTGGYVILRIRSDNPGKWFLHCHIEVHALDGMAMVVNEATDRSPDPPLGFPVCQHFYNDPSRDIQFITQQQQLALKDEKSFWSRNTITVVVTSILGVIICVQFIFIYFSLSKSNNLEDKPKTCARHAKEQLEKQGGLAKEIEREIGSIRAVKPTKPAPY